MRWVRRSGNDRFLADKKKHFNVYWKTCANFISSADSLCAPEAKFVSIIQAFYSLDENLLLELGEQKSIIECGLSRMVRSGRKESVKPNAKKNGSNRRGLRSRRRMSINYISFTCATYTHTERDRYIVFCCCCSLCHSISLQRAPIGGRHAHDDVQYTQTTRIRA